MHWFSTTPKTKESKGHWMPDKHKRKQYRPMWVNQNKDKLIMLLTHHAKKAKDKGSFENYFSLSSPLLLFPSPKKISTSKHS
jgi:hypothetical protein